MAFNLPPLPWLRAFEASARLGNFTRAAEELLITPAAVSYQVRQLEQHLGYPLFDRVHRELALTRLGQTYLPSVEKAFSDLSIATVSVFGERGRKPVRFRCLNSFGQLWMIPRLSDFRQIYPDIELQMISASWAETLNPELFDIDIRFGDGTWTDGSVAFLVNDPVIPVCHPELSLDPALPDIQQLAEAERIDIMGVVDTWESYFRMFSHPVPKRNGLQVDQTLSALELAANGHGHALVLETLAAPYLESGRLVRSANRQLKSRHSYYLVTSGPLEALPGDAKLFCHWMSQKLAADAIT
ncbi:LysR family transcriptional regulator [Roseibium denhamense]|uniref:LysR family transcriptional regulator, glycine cleavage system transcriptional activator n=1 Tax=Roseibium denhamense TaxID=76305 RepID=A0ABY1P4Q4_9HYPH|nr:LysR family transcriptional regulator [Roseibium denhamense]MTI05158.1 LysR family transcriptional regulator [Roseibium denhamense]SMP25897.1 LysR family transcriptional regulator, glycine cleavage system transcriptional activator [Roseibium denhamense]